MENQKTKTGYYTQANTVRISPEELEFVNDNYEEIAGTETKISFSKFFMLSVFSAVSTVKGKTIEVVKDNPEHLKRIEELEAFNNELNQKLSDVESDSKGLVLNLTPDWKKHIWGILEIMKKENKLGVTTYEDLIIFLFKLVHSRNELILNAQDVEYLKTLEYKE
jgi:hypothetical protein